MAKAQQQAAQPFLDADGKPVLRRAFCVFMDVLGFTEKMAESFRAHEGQSALERFYEVFTQRLNSTFKRDVDGEHRAWDLKVFTDNIVLGYTFDSWHAEPEFGSVADKVGIYQLFMALENFFVRGGIAVGELFLDENTAFGPALLEAYRLEQTIARDPRVVLSDGVVQMVRQHVSFYGNPLHAPQNQLVLMDADQRIFIDYLHYLIGWIDDKPAVDAESVAKHKENVVRNLERHRASPRVWAKYQWVANYHNYFCNRCRNFEEYQDDLAIESKFLTIQPTRFVPL